MPERRTKIVATIGPAQDRVRAGVPVCVASGTIAARRDLGKGARVILFDVAPAGSTDVPSVINTINS